jgi:hypothetical protein
VPIIGHYYSWGMTLAAVVWDFWLAVPLAAMAIVGLLATVVGYVKNVSSPRYPKKRQ